MNNTRIAQIVLIIFLSFNVLFAENDSVNTKWSPLQISLFRPVQLVSEQRSIYGLRISLLYGSNEDVFGLDIGMGNNAYCVKGIQIAGIINDVLGYDTKNGKLNGRSAVGAQVSGIFNFANNMIGVQVAGLGNTAVNNAIGLQVAVFGNAAQKMQGVQIGASNINYGKESQTVGVQIGALNYTHKMIGVQIGIYNECDTLKGIQIGLINFISSQGFPIINARFLGFLIVKIIPRSNVLNTLDEAKIINAYFNLDGPIEKGWILK